MKKTFRKHICRQPVPGIAFPSTQPWLQEVAGEAMKRQPAVQYDAAGIEALNSTLWRSACKVLQETLVPPGQNEEGPLRWKVSDLCQRVTVDVTTYNLADLMGELVKCQETPSCTASLKRLPVRH